MPNYFLKDRSSAPLRAVGRLAHPMSTVRPLAYIYSALEAQATRFERFAAAPADYVAKYLQEIVLFRRKDVYSLRQGGASLLDERVERFVRCAVSSRAREFNQDLDFRLLQVDTERRHASQRKLY
jgi:hypothetical protein